MKGLIRVRVQYASRQQCCKTHKRPLPLPLPFRASTLKLTKRPARYICFINFMQEPAKMFTSQYIYYSYCTEIWTRSLTVVNCFLPPLGLRLKCVWTPSHLSVYFVKRVFVVSNSTRDIAVP